MALVGHLFAGITDYFRAYGAKNYSKVLENAGSRFSPSALSLQRDLKVSEFRNRLSQNENLTSTQINRMVAQRNVRHAVGDFMENTLGLVGAGTSLVGGTAGYLTKTAVTAPFKIGRWVRQDPYMNAATRALGGAAASTGIIRGTVETIAAAAHSGVPLVHGATDAVRDAIPMARAVKDRIVTNARAGDAVPDELMLAAQAAPKVIANTGKFMGQGVAEYGRGLGQDVWRGAKWFHENRDSRGIKLAATGAALAFMPAAFNGGLNEGAYQYDMQQVAANLSMSNDGGGTFLRPNYAPQVDDMGATGDLVFALHTLRNGGQ